MYEWRIGRSCIYKNYVHLVFVTKYRRDVFSVNMLKRVQEIFYETCKQMDCELLNFGAEHDHVHIMVSVHPKIAISRLVGKLKGKSAYILRREYWDCVKYKLWGNHFWSPSYCVVSCGGDSLDIIKAYIENQRMPPSEKQVQHSKIRSGKSAALLTRLAPKGNEIA